MIRDQQAQPIAVFFFALGIFLGVMAFFSAISISPVIRDAFVTNSDTPVADHQLPVTELYRQAGRNVPADAIRM